MEAISPKERSWGWMRMSPTIAATPSRTAARKPEETATATIITKKLTAMATAASFP
jgi:hypothetical protein